MNKNGDALEHLVRLARQEIPPCGDVRSAVLERLRARRPALAKPMLIFAAGYGAVAAASLLVGVSLMQRMGDPFNSLFESAHIVLP